MEKRKKFLIVSCVILVILLIILALKFWRDGKEEEDTSETGIPTSEVPSENTEEAATDNAEEPVTEQLTEEEYLEKQINEILGAMTLEQKIYQMFVITPEALTGYQTVTSAGDATRNSLAEYPVGGIVYFADNLLDATQTTEMLRNTQEFALNIEGLPVFLCVDEEGGRVARIGNNAGFDVPQVGPMQNVSSEDEAYDAGNIIGSYLKDLGFNVDFAPDTDVLTNEDNTAIGDRSFGSDPQKVLQYGSAYASGLQDNGIKSTFKHFPGHGATEGDTHEGFAYTDKTYDELLQAELVPFAGANEARIDFIMVSHISVPSIIGDDTPSSLSYQMITEILRQDLGYEGIIITDALNMGAIVDSYSSDQASLLAIKAGADMVLMPEDFHAAVDSVISAVDRGEIEEERINDSVKRIIRAKLQMIK